MGAVSDGMKLWDWWSGVGSGEMADWDGVAVGVAKGESPGSFEGETNSGEIATGDGVLVGIGNGECSLARSILGDCVAVSVM